MTNERLLFLGWFLLGFGKGGFGHRGDDGEGVLETVEGRLRCRGVSGRVLHGFS